MITYDAAVIGVGGVGSAALFHLASRGLQVIGLEQFSIAHDRGSSHGQTRIIRTAYFENSAYVPLLIRSYELWRSLEVSSGQRLLEPTGLLEVGRPDGEILPGVVTSAQEHSLEIERLTSSQSEHRFPMYHVPDDMEAIFEPTAGMLYVEECVATHVRAAEAKNATVRQNTRVDRIELDAAPIVIHLENEEIAAERLVICGGAWASQLLDLRLPLEIARKHLHWYSTDQPNWQAKRGCPTFFYELPDGCFYGFPAIDAQGVKIAEHTGGEKLTTPDDFDRSPSPEDDQRVLAFLSHHLIHVFPRRTRHETCLYTLTPDAHFIVDRHKMNPNIAYAAGLSGHGFKFAPVLGEILTDLVVHGESDQPIDFLSSKRFEV